jgi:hypothetical protein
MNPIAFNPDTMTVSQVKQAVVTLRTLFDQLENGASAEDIANFLAQSRDYLAKVWRTA